MRRGASAELRARLPNFQISYKLHGVLTEAMTPASQRRSAALLSCHPHTADAEGHTSRSRRRRITGEKGRKSHTQKRSSGSGSCRFGGVAGQLVDPLVLDV